MRYFTFAMVVLAVMTQGVFAQDAKNHRGEDCKDKDFRGQDLTGANFEGANCYGANFRGVNLKGADMRVSAFKYAFLREAYCVDANFAGVNFEQISLADTIFHNADLRGARGIGDITKTNFNLANICGADLSGAFFGPGGTPTFLQAKYDATTKWPDKIDPKQAGAIEVKIVPLPIPALPLPNANPLPMSNPQPMAASLGTELKFNTAKLYFTGTVTGDEANKVVEYLRLAGFGEFKELFQLNKAGDEYQVRMHIGNDVQKEDIQYAEEEVPKLAKLLGGKTVVHLCDATLTKTLKVVGGPVINPNPNPQPMPAAGSLGTEVKIGSSRLYFTSAVAAADAKKFGEYLVKIGFGDTEQRYQLHKVGDEFQVKIEVGDEVIKDDVEFAESMRPNFATTLGGKAVVHLCTDDFVKTLKVIGEAAPGAQPNPMPTPMPNPLVRPEPMPNPVPAEPRPMPMAPANVVSFGKGRIFFSTTASKEEATKLGQFLVRELDFGSSPQIIQLNKADAVFQIRLIVKNGVEKDQAYVSDCQELGRSVAKSVFPSAAVEIHLCNDMLQTLQVVKP